MTRQVDPISSTSKLTDKDPPSGFFVRQWNNLLALVRDVSATAAAALAAQTTANAVQSRTITAGTALTGGGNLSANITISHGNQAAATGTFGNSTMIPVITVDAQGHVANITTTAASSGNSSLSNALASAHIFVGNATGVATDRAMSGDVTIDNAGVTVLGNTSVTPGSYGSATKVPQIVVDSKGRLTSAGNVTISGGGGASVDLSPFSDGAITKPAAADFTIADDTTANHGTGSKADLTSRGVALTHTQSGTPISSQSLFFQAAVSNTLVSMTAYLMPNYNDRNSNWFYGIGVRDNTGKIHAFGLRNSGGGATYSDFRYTTISAISSATNQTGGNFAVGGPIWLRLAKVSTNFVFSVSFDGENYFTVETISATTFVGATLNDVGILLVNNLGSAGAPVTVDCFSFAKS